MNEILSARQFSRTGHVVLSRLKDVLRPWVPYLPRYAPAPSWRRSFRILAHYGFSPATVFDIGVGFGTPMLYRAFPDAHYYLIDPTSEALVHMRRIVGQLDGEILNVALGDRDGEAALEIRSDIQGSTLFEEWGSRDVLRTERVPLRRFDRVIGDFRRPALCKIDVQGAEMMVLEGMTGRIGEIDAFIIETSMIATVRQGPEISDVIAFMKAHGFVVFDIVGMARRPLDGATAQLDMLFVAESSYLRADRRWAEDAAR